MDRAHDAPEVVPESHKQVLEHNYPETVPHSTEQYPNYQYANPQYTAPQYDDSQGYAAHTGVAPSPGPQTILDEKDHRRKVCGIARSTFWLLVILAIVIIGAVVGGAVGGTIAAQNAQRNAGSNATSTPSPTATGGQPSPTSAKIQTGSDPTVMRVGTTYYSAQSIDGGIVVRSASSIVGLGASGVQSAKVWSDTAGHGEVWAPELIIDGETTYIYFSAGTGADHRMYYINAPSPLGPYTNETKLSLPDDQWAVDGTMFVFHGQRWFVWSGWASANNTADQNLYICSMSSPVTPTGKRFIISQPRETWEKASGTGTTLINEGPEAIIDPNGQLHIIYSANANWDTTYCLSDLRLRVDGDPTYVWDWYKANGCLFGSHNSEMMDTWDITQKVDGPGHNTFVLPSGDINNSPGGTNKIPFVYHAVDKGTSYTWANRAWYEGSFVWWNQTNYHRANVPGNNDNSGYSLKFFE